MPGVKGRSGGRNARTVEALKASGTFDSSRHAGIENPDPPRGRPKPPGKLGKIGRKQWRRLVDLLDESKTLALDVADPLYQYCHLFEESEHIAAQRMERHKTIELMQESLVDMSPESRSESIANITSLLQLDAKDATQIRQYRLALRVYMVEFGLTPAARSRVKELGNQRKNVAPTSPFARLQGQAKDIRRVK